ncbi:hypothetical protein C8Q77DRAFT_144373 [Trametes polyzona]|nr:hypothetical protein C8Q77DRAFT_144373 [Trametes polyzona]
MQDSSLLTIEVFVLFIEALLFGGFLVLYPMSVWILMYRERRTRRSRVGLWMFVTVTMMFLLALVHLAFDVQYTVLAFVRHGSTPGGPTRYITSAEGNGALAHIIDPILFAILTLVGDSFMTYRTYVVWERKPIAIVLPVLLLTGKIVCAGSIGYGLYNSPGRHGDGGFFADAIFGRMIGYFVLTLLTNLSMTLLLLGRILWSGREIRKYRIGRAAAGMHWRVMKTIIQSEIVYSVAVVLNLAAYVARSNLVLITFAALPPLVGISFTLIITRIGLSEVVDSSSGNGAALMETIPAVSTAIDDHTLRTSSPIAINVMVSRMDDIGLTSHIIQEDKRSPIACNYAESVVVIGPGTGSRNHSIDV